MAARHVTDDPRTLHRGAFLELIDRDGWEYAHRFATLGVVMEHIRFYRADSPRRVCRALGDGDEVLTVHRVPLAELRRFIAARQDAGVQIDVKLWAGLFLAGLSEA